MALLASGAGCVHTLSEKDRQLSETHYDLCVNAFQYQRVEEALENCNQAVFLNPDNPEAHNGLGLVWWSKHGLPKAKFEFEKAVELKPDFSDAWNNLGALSIEMKDFALAKASFEHALGNPLYKTPYSARANLGWVYHLQGDHKRALEMIKEALQTEPNYCMGYKQLAQVQEAVGKADAAEQSWIAFARYCGTDPEAQYQAGRIHQSRSQPFEAAKSYLRCMKSAQKISQSHILVKTCTDALNALPALSPEEEEQLKKAVEKTESEAPSTESHDIGLGGQ
jgi:type IV pilus assembly protein PilF